MTTLRVTLAYLLNDSDMTVEPHLECVAQVEIVLLGHHKLLVGAGRKEAAAALCCVKIFDKAGNLRYFLAYFYRKYL